MNLVGKICNDAVNQHSDERKVHSFYLVNNDFTKGALRNTSDQFNHF